MAGIKLIQVIQRPGELVLEIIKRKDPSKLDQI